MDTWSAEDLATLSSEEEIAIQTRRADGNWGKPVTIWIVGLDDALYVRSAYGSDNPWFRRARARPSGLITVSGRTFAVALTAADPALKQAIDAAYEAKYHRYSRAILDPMTSAVAGSATLRVTPTARTANNPGQ